MSAPWFGRVVLLLGPTLTALGPALQSPQDAQPAAAPAAAQVPVLPAPAISVARVLEDKQNLLRATVTLKGAPLEGAQVSFGVARTFGVLDLGSDTTLDDGTAGVPFPDGLPGGPLGIIDVSVSVKGTKDYGVASAHAAIDGAGVLVTEAVPFPHALWSSKPLWPLVAIIVVLLAGVWSTYVFVVRQLVKIHREGSSC
jgi:hypothetical protein